MIKYFTLCLISFFSTVIAVYTQSPTAEWVKGFGSSADDGGAAIATDKMGNVYTTGAFYGTVDFDPGADTFNLTAFGGKNIFLLKQDGEGNLKWAKRIGVGTVTAMAVNSDMNIYLTGAFSGSVDFDPGTNSLVLQAKGNTDVFVVKLDSSANLQWAKQLGDTLPDGGTGIAVDSTGNVYVTGTADIKDPSYYYPPSYTIFYTKMNAEGTLLWEKKLNADRPVYSQSIATDMQGNLYATGHFAGNMDFDPDSTTFDLVSSGEDIFLLKLNDAGALVWAKSIQAGQAFTIALDKVGNIYASGRFYGFVGQAIDFDPGVGEYILTSTGYADLYILKLDASGEFRWARQIKKSNGSTLSHTMALDNLGNVYTTGAYQKRMDFDPGEDEYNVDGTNYPYYRDAFILKLDTGGNFSWVHRINASGGTAGSTSVAVDNNNNVLTTGRYGGQVDFDSTSTDFRLTAIGNYNIFVFKMSQSIGTGIVEELPAQILNIFPNPTSGVIRITNPFNDINKIGVAIYTLSGEIVTNYILEPASAFVLDFSTFPTGTYILELTSSGKNVTSKITLVK